MVVQLIQGGSGDLRTNYPGLINLLAATFFPIGLIMLVLTGQDLCTANFMLVGMTCLKKKTKLWELPVNWIIVFFGNLAGALSFVAFLGKSIFLKLRYGQC
jgi:formate/nitrite transporter FocA (FNT family)